MAFVFAAFVLIITLLVTAVMAFANGMSDSPDGYHSPVPVLLGGLGLTIVIAASHWLPHIGW